MFISSLYKHSFVLTSSLVNDLLRYSQHHSVTQLFPSGSTFPVDFSYFFALSLLSVKNSCSLIPQSSLPDPSLSFFFQSFVITTFAITLFSLLRFQASFSLQLVTLKF